MPNNLFENLLLRGAVFKTHVGVPSGKRKLNLQRLGIPSVIENSELITSGQLVLIPNDELKIFNQARANANGIIEKYGVPMGSIGLLVPNERIEAVNNELEEMKEEFLNAKEDLARRYPEIKQRLISQWNEEIIAIAARQVDHTEGYIFEVLRRIDNEFHEWWYFDRKFHFSWREYHDVNDMAAGFIEDSTRSMLDKMREFAEGLQTRLREEKLSERNIAPIRRWIDSIGQAIRSFENERLNRLVENLETWTEEGVDVEVRENRVASVNMANMLDDVIATCTDQIDEIAAESVAALTTQRRTIQRRVG